MHKAKFFCLLRLHTASGEDKLLRDLHADESRQDKKTAPVGNQTDLREGLSEKRTRCRQDEIGEQCQIAASARGRPVDETDNGQLQMNNIVNPVMPRTHAIALLHRRHLAVSHTFDVATRAKGTACAGQDNGFYILARTFLDILKRSAQVLPHFRAESVSRLWSIQGDSRDLVADIVQNMAVSHAVSPCSRLFAV